MSWFKVDDSFYDHPKVLGLSDKAIALWVKAGSYCCQHNTYGAVPKGVPALLGARGAEKELVDCGMWKRTPNGYQFSEWRKHQDGKYRRNIPNEVRKSVLERDGHRCVDCGATESLSLDHIVPYRDDGPDTPDNLRVLCMSCNNTRYQEERRAQCLGSR